MCCARTVIFIDDCLRNRHGSSELQFVRLELIESIVVAGHPFKRRIHTFILFQFILQQTRTAHAHTEYNAQGKDEQAHTYKPLCPCIRLIGHCLCVVCAYAARMGVVAAAASAPPLPTTS
jgi:hypothetical protein